MKHKKLLWKASLPFLPQQKAFYIIVYVEEHSYIYN